VFIEQGGGAGEPRLRVFTGRLQRPARNATTARVRAVESDAVKVLSAADSVFRGAFRGGSGSRMVAIVPGIVALGGDGVVACPVFGFARIDVRVIQSGSARCALVLPMTGAGVPQPLAAGNYRLTLAIDRSRWSTTDPPDDLNRYRDAGTLLFDL
jgi:hypothetical protein